MRHEPPFIVPVYTRCQRANLRWRSGRSMDSLYLGPYYFWSDYRGRMVAVDEAFRLCPGAY